MFKKFGRIIMGRKFNLKKEVRQCINNTRKGSFVTRKDKLVVLELIIEDLFKTTSTCLPAQLRLLNKQHIYDLVDYWKKKSLKTTTIQNRISTLRFLNKIAQLELDIPSNKALKVHDRKNAPIITMPEFNDALKKICHPVIKSVIEFQIGFGLTKLESMRLSLSNAIQNESLSISRTTASNKKDRSIPILTDEQQIYIMHRRKLLEDHKSFIKLISERLLCYQYEAEHMWVGIDYHVNWRQTYISHRYQTLAQEKKHSEAIKILLSETGISSKYKLAPWLEDVVI